MALGRVHASVSGLLFSVAATTLLLYKPEPIEQPGLSNPVDNRHGTTVLLGGRLTCEGVMRYELRCEQK